MVVLFFFEHSSYPTNYIIPQKCYINYNKPRKEKYISKIYSIYNLRAHILAKIRGIKINIKISWQVFILVRLSYVWTEG